MSTITTKGSNGVSYGYIHNVTAQDAIDGEVIIDFQSSMDLVASVQVYVASTGVVVALADAVITYPAAGQVSIANGAVTFALADTQRIDVVAQYARGDV